MSTNLTSRARVPTPKQLNSVGVKKDEFETFWHILLTYCQQDAGYLHQSHDTLAYDDIYCVDIHNVINDMFASRS